MSTKTEIRPGAYYDSIVLMQLQAALANLPGVEDTGVMMGTPANLALLEEGGLLPDSVAQAGLDDLIIVVRATNEENAANTLAQVDTLLAKRRATTTSEFRPKSLESAAKALPEAAWVLISVPGRYAAGVARKALDLGKHVFLYSDNVSIEDEIQLKQTAREKGLLVMGPDCGTAIINGVGLGFANRVRQGGIGLVGASGTGLQAVTAGIHNLGGGISHAIGTGGRDLKRKVGGITARQGLDLLARDPETNVIVLVSKPPEPSVAARLLAAAQRTGKPVVVNFTGHPPPARQLVNLHFAVTLQEAAEISVQCSVASSQYSVASSQSLNTDYRLRGLFSGGTLAYETMLGLQTFLSPLYSNVPITADQRLPNPLKSQAHTILDLGEDEFTQGRLHPMMDNNLRIRRMRQEADDPEVGMLLLDVVLGEGAHPDPAGDLGPVIREVTHDRGVEVIAIVVGTEEDPQGLKLQVEKLEDAGAAIFTTVTDAIEYISSQWSVIRNPFDNSTMPVDIETLQVPLTAINVGVESFFESLVNQGAQAIHVDWRPPAGGNERLMSLLAKLGRGN
ncbi:MAG: acyl-CoA synthetase FdrA [Anaerolineales bacterium]